MPGNRLTAKLKESLQNIVNSKKKEIKTELKNKSLNAFKMKLKKRVKKDQQSELALLLATTPNVKAKHVVSK